MKKNIFFTLILNLACIGLWAQNTAKTQGEACTAYTITEERITCVQSLTLNNTNVGIQKGGTFQFEATTSPVNAINDNVTWSIKAKTSGDTGVTIDAATGKITCKNTTAATVGHQFTVTATIAAAAADGCAKKTATATVTVVSTNYTYPDGVVPEYVYLNTLNWCTCNVGASAPDDPGLYFGWGDVTGYAQKSGHSFSEANYKKANEGYSITGSSFTPGDVQHDAATKYNSNWKMPKKDQWEKLTAASDSITPVWIDGKTKVYNNNYHIKGAVFIRKGAKANSGQFIFVPAVGCYAGDANLINGNDNEETPFGSYWTTSRPTKTSTTGYYFRCGIEGGNVKIETTNTGNPGLHFGLSIRGIKK